MVLQISDFFTFLLLYSIYYVVKVLFVQKMSTHLYKTGHISFILSDKLDLNAIYKSFTVHTYIRSTYITCDLTSLEDIAYCILHFIEQVIFLQVRVMISLFNWHRWLQTWKLKHLSKLG